jgi:probable biosynthetic protein (TIGR04098 family)
VVHEATLTLGLPHTNRWGLAEDALMKYAGHLHWSSVAATIGTPLSRLRTIDGGEVYATFYFVEEVFPSGAPIESLQLDDALRFRIEQRAFKSIALEGQIIFDRVERLPELTCDASPIAPSAGRGRHPYVRFGNIFITPEAGNCQLRVAAPANGDFSRFPALPNDDNPYQLTRSAQASGNLGLLDEPWKSADPGREGFDVMYAIDPDRDTNGAGLVYFANFFAFMDAAERTAAANAVPAVRDCDGRLVQSRRTAFYGNVDVTGRLRTRVWFFLDPKQPSLIGARYAMHREEDGVMICLSEAIKRILHV